MNKTEQNRAGAAAQELDKSREQRKRDAAVNLNNYRKEKANCDQFRNGEWTLHKLDPLPNGEQRWSLCKFGPRVYLTCDKATARQILRALSLQEIAS